VLLTPAENAALAVQDALAERARAAAAQHFLDYPDGGAGHFFDRARGLFQVFVTGDAAGTVDALTPVTGREKLEVLLVENSEADLEAAREKIFALRDELGSQGTVYRSSQYDVRENCIVVTVTGDRLAADALLAQAVEPRLYAVVEGSGPQPLGARGTTAPPLRGGAELVGYDSVCSNGFIAYRDTSPRTFFSIFAAHCTYVGDYIYNPGYDANRDGLRSTADALGRVDKREWRVGQTVNADAARFPIYVGLATNDIITNPGYYRDITSVEGRAGDARGNLACQAGIMTGFDCGTIVDTSVDYCMDDDVSGYVCFDTGRKAEGLVGREGDSGGPVFYFNKAMGIVSSGDPISNGTTNNVIYSHIYDVTTSLDVKVVTY